VGDVASWRNSNYRFVGHEADRDDSADDSDRGRHRSFERGYGSWRSQWERVSSCEYR
jgi:hypothetical protein